MRPQSSIRHSKKTSENSEKVLASIHFNRKRLVSELLSLGNPKITLPLAETISQEVEKELKQQDPLLLSPEIISDLVQFKLEELGLIEIKPHRQKARKSLTEKAMKVTHPFMPNPSPLRLTLKSAPLMSAKETLAWTEEGKKAFRLASEWLEMEEIKFSDPSSFLEQMSKAIAEIDSNFDGFHDNEAVETQFYNRMATLDFIPGSMIFKTHFNTGKFSSPSSGYSVLPTSEKVYETLQTFNGEDLSKNTTLGISLLNKPGIEEGALLLLKLLKTSLEYRSQQSPHPIKQDLFLSFADISKPEDDRFSSSPFSTLLQWIEEEENRRYFSLSLGVPGRTLPHLPAPESFEQSLVRILHQHLLVNASVRLYFLERCLEAMTTSQVLADRTPSPQSPGLYSPGEVVPSLFLNLSVMLKEEEIDWDRLRRAVRQAVHFLDNVIDLWSYPNAASEKITKSNRNIALGVMGLADLLFTLRVPYNSQEALDIADKFSSFIEEEAIKASSELAKVRGVFPNYIGSKWQEKGLAVRNAQICSLPWDPLPSLIAQTSTGLEPHASLVELEGFQGEKPKYLIHPFLAETAQKRGFFSDKVLARVIELGSLGKVSEIPDDIRKVFVSHKDINIHWHLLMASVFEKHFDYGVVKVCPLSVHSDQSENIQNILEQARELGLKSLWIKREGEVIHPSVSEMVNAQDPLSILEELPESLPQSCPLEELEMGLPENNEVTQVAWDEKEFVASFDLLSEKQPEEKTEVIHPEDFTEKLPLDETNAPPRLSPVLRELEKIEYLHPRARPDFLKGNTQKFLSCCGDLFVTLNQDEKGPYEILAQLSKTFGNETILLEVVSKLISLALQSGVDPETIYEQLHGVVCLKHLNTSQGDLKSPIETLAQAIEKLIRKSISPEEDKTEVISKEAFAS